VRLLAAAGAWPDTRAAVAAMEFRAGDLETIARRFPDGCLEITAPDAQTLVDPALLRAVDVASAICVPITVRGRIAGVQAHGYRTRTGPFTPLERKLAAGMAQATAHALENARLISDLQAASRLKTEFVATMSHELRTPLNVIMGYTDMLLEEAFGALAPPQHETLARVARSAEELLELVNATLDVGRLESGREPVERAPVDVAAVCEELDRELRPLVAEETTLAWRHDVLPTVLADRTKLKTILRNLVGNALKFTRAGRVEVDVAWDDGVLELRVSDTGIGIAPDQLPHVFEMFRQADGSSTRAPHRAAPRRAARRLGRRHEHARRRLDLHRAPAGTAGGAARDGQLSDSR
jgi:signal transduction histidine kinase